MAVAQAPPMGLFGVGRPAPAPKPAVPEPQEVPSEIAVKPPPGDPPAAAVGRVTHFSIELQWDAALKKENRAAQKGDGRVRVAVQQQGKSGEWANVYTGYAKRHILEGLEASTEYHYRIRFMNDAGNSEWSPLTTISTTKEPINGEHIHKAVQRQDVKMLENLLDKVLPVDCPDKFGFTPLMVAAQKGYTDVLQILVKNGADVNFQNDAGKTCLMMAAFAGQLEAVKELRQVGANYEVQDRGGSKALHWAMDGKNPDLISWMVEDGADVNSIDLNGWTPLLRVAAVGGDKDSSGALIRSGADVNQTDKDGKSPLMIGVINGHLGLVELLLENGADLLLKSSFGKTAYEMALSMERRGIIKLVEDHMDKHGMKRY